MDPHDHAKELAARKALEYVEDGMVVGLGTGWCSASNLALASSARFITG